MKLSYKMKKVLLALQKESPKMFRDFKFIVQMSTLNALEKRGLITRAVGNKIEITEAGKGWHE